MMDHVAAFAILLAVVIVVSWGLAELLERIDE